MKRIQLVFVYLLVGISAWSQEIMLLPPDPAISSGTLPDGISFYIVSDPELKGMADFALVQRVGRKNTDVLSPEEVVADSRKALGAKPHLLSPTAQDYFSRSGAAPGEKGFVEVRDDAVIFRFENVMLASAPCVLDSTLLVLMDVVAAASSAPSDHALIVVGDVVPEVVEEKMRMLSYMIPARESLPTKEYLWQENAESEISVLKEDRRSLSVVSAKWKIEKTPQKQMNTVLPLIYEKYMSQLGIIAVRRIKAGLEQTDTPVGDISYSYTHGYGSLDDAAFEVSVAVPDSCLRRAVSVLASVMARLDASDAGEDELVAAEYEYIEKIKDTDYVDRCISAYLCNTSLASRDEIIGFLSSRSLPDSTDLSLFNSIASASVDKRRNLSLECRTDESMSAGMVRDVFEKAWESAFSMVETAKDTTRRVMSLYGPSEKVRVRSVAKEHLSGGTQWTLSNGFKVIFKDMPTPGEVYYRLALNGGYGGIPDLNAGEGGYFSELLKFCRIGGLRGEDMHDELRQNGMTMDFNVSLSSTTFTGCVPDDSLEYLVRVLLTIMNDRQHDGTAFSRFLKEAPLRKEYSRGGRADRIAAIDSILCPDYRYTSSLMPETLTEDFAVKAEKFMDRQSSKMNDGVLILVGDIDQASLRRVLYTYAGGFRTDDVAFSRPTVNYQPHSGTVTYAVEGDMDSADMVISAPLALTADNYFAAAITVMVLKKVLSQAVTGSGTWLSLVHNCRKYPQERFNLMVSLGEAPETGFADNTLFREPIEVLDSVREVFASSADISEKDMSSCKDLLKHYFSQRRRSPQYWLKAIAMRHLDGKDFTTGCDAKIDAVTVDKVKSLMKLLGEGSRVEYITTSK